MNRVVNRRHEYGFTLIELLLSMTFVTVLLLAIAITVLQIANVYNKGLTMRAVDQAGRSISLDIRQTLAQSQPFNVDTAFRLQNDQGSNLAGGRLCTGTYSYIWNVGKAIGAPVNKYSVGQDEIRFVKVRDSGGQYCANLARPVLQADATELLSAGDRDLAVQSFTIKRLIADPTVGQALYRVVMEIGTNNQDALEQSGTLDTLDTSCKPPSDDSTLQQYCAVNQFDFTAQAGNKGVQ